MKVHVTGGSGFLGGHVIPRLLAAGHAVSALSRGPDSDRRLVGLGAVLIRGDLDQPESVDRAFAASQAEALVNLASLGFGHAPAIVAAAEEAGLRRSVFVSTTAIFTGMEPASKAVRREAEAVIRGSALDWTIIRPTMIYGTREDRNMARLLRLVRRSPVVLLPGGGGCLQQPVHVDDVAHAVVAALGTSAAVGQAYDVAGADALSLRQIVEGASAAVQRRPRLVPVPLAPALAMARVYELLAVRPRLRAEQLARLAENKAFDIDAARRDLGFAPRSFSEGIRQQAALS